MVCVGCEREAVTQPTLFGSLCAPCVKAVTEDLKEFRTMMSKLKRNTAIIAPPSKKEPRHDE